MTPERFDHLRQYSNGAWLDECLDEIARLAQLAYVPGGWYCPKCKFQLTTSTLYAKSGTIGVNRKTPEACPNDGTPMLPQTWEADAKAMAERMPESVAMGMIHDLRKNQGAAVRILCDNDDPQGDDDAAAVEVCDEWTGWKDRRFYGKDVRDALWKARSAMYEATRGAA